MNRNKQAGVVVEHAGKRYYDITAGAAFLGKSTTWLYQTARREHTPRYRFTNHGRWFFFLEDDLINLRDTPRIIA